MNILVISPTENILTTRGKRFPDVASELAKNHEVTYLTTAFRHSDKSIISHDEVNSLNTLYKIIFFRIGSYKNNFGLGRVLWNIRFALSVYQFILRSKNWDKIYVPNRPPEILYLVLKAVGRDNRHSVNVDILDIWPDAIPYKRKLSIMAFYAYNHFLNSRIYRGHLGNVFYVSKSFKNWCLKYASLGKGHFPLHFIPLGLSRGQRNKVLSEEEFKSKKTSRLRKTRLTAIFAGTISDQFDLVDLLSRNHRIDDLLEKVILVGNSQQGAHYTRLINWLEHHKISFIDYGEVNYEKYQGLLLSSDIGLFNMKMSGMPKKIWDYSLAALPILSHEAKAADLEMEGISFLCIENFSLDVFTSTLRRVSFEEYNKLMSLDSPRLITEQIHQDNASISRN